MIVIQDMTIIYIYLQLHLLLYRGLLPVVLRYSTNYHLQFQYLKIIKQLSLLFILPCSPSSHKSDIGHIKLSLHSLCYTNTFIHNIHNRGTYGTFISLVELSNIEYNSTHTLIYIYICVWEHPHIITSLSVSHSQLPFRLNTHPRSTVPYDGCLNPGA